MTSKKIPYAVLLPRKAVADAKLIRPDWTVQARHTENILTLDKNETTDPELRRLIADVLKTLPVNAVFEYPECAPYYHLLADYLEISPRNLLFTAGADGAIRMVFEAFLSPGETVLLTSPTFAMFPIYARMYGGKVVELEYESSEHGPRLTVDTICRSLEEHRPRLLCLSNPDSPTGTIFQPGDTTRIIRTAAGVGAVILVDEAYYPFSGETSLDQINAFPNMVISRTFAKAWGLAGLRLGFAAAHPDMATILHKVRPMYEVNGFALAAMAEMLKHAEAMEQSVKRINDGKAWFLDRMRGLEFNVLDCAGNFLHVDFGDRRNTVHAALEGRVLYKPSFPDKCLAGYSRFSTGPKTIMSVVDDIIEQAL